MNNLPKNESQEAIKMGMVGLKVKDMDKEISFYQEVIGLELLDKNETNAILGIKSENKPLVELIKTIELSTRDGVAGLYHMAFLVPTRKDLGNILYRFLQEQVPLIGASDHGYSEAIYLEDLEGNGIEIYRDKSMSEWDIKSDGTIVGVTEPMDVAGVMDARDTETTSNKIPEGTIMGHVHLSVSNLETTKNFYMDMLGMELKYRFGMQANFLAFGNYHHHLGTNTWLGRGLQKPTANDLGLAYYSIILPDSEVLETMKQNLLSSGMLVNVGLDKEVIVMDPSGIEVKLVVA